MGVSGRGSRDVCLAKAGCVTCGVDGKLLVSWAGGRSGGQAQTGLPSPPAPFSTSLVVLHRTQHSTPIRLDAGFVSKPPHPSPTPNFH